MFGIGFTEMLVIAGIALIFIGPEQFPSMARTLGRFINELRRSTDEIKSQFTSSIDLNLNHRPSPPVPPLPQDATSGTDTVPLSEPLDPSHALVSHNHDPDHSHDGDRDRDHEIDHQPQGGGEPGAPEKPPKGEGEGA